MAILYFVKQKRFVGQGRLESPSLPFFYESVKRRMKTKKIEKKKDKKKTK